MGNTNNTNEVITVPHERLARLEAEMSHTTGSMHDIKEDIREIKESSKNVELAVVKLAEIAKTNNRLFPRIEQLEKNQQGINIKLAAWGGGLTVVMFVLGYVIPHVFPTTPPPVRIITSTPVDTVNADLSSLPSSSKTSKP